MSGQVCVSLGHCPMVEAESISIPTEWAEVRFDLLEGFSPHDTDAWHPWIRSMLARFPRLIVTFRPDPQGLIADAEREQVIAQALDLGVRYVDVDTHEEPALKWRLLEVIGHHGAHLIHSAHLEQFPQSWRELCAYVEQLLAVRPFLAKLAVPCTLPEEVEQMMELYNHYSPLLAIAMGRVGQRSRVEACRRGAPYSYAYLAQPTGPGQLSAQELFTLLSA